MRFEFPKQHRDGFGPIRKACELTKVSKSGYYEYAHRRKPNAQIEREALEGFVKEAFERHRARYGYRRINRELRKTGVFAGEKRVLHVMRRLGLVAKGATRKHGVRKAVEAGDPRLNIVERAFAVGQKNKLWMGGITCIPTKEGWPCLATVIDAFSRKVVGWPMSDRITEKLATGAIEQAIGRKDPQTTEASSSMTTKESSAHRRRSSAASARTGPRNRYRGRERRLTTPWRNRSSRRSKGSW